MTVSDAMNALELGDQPLNYATLELALTHKLEVDPARRETWEGAYQLLQQALKPSAAPSHSDIEIDNGHHTREILIFNEEREVLYGEDDALETPQPVWQSEDSDLLPDTAVLYNEPVPEVLTARPAPALETGVSGEWELMLESLEADGLIAPETEEQSSIAVAQPAAVSAPGAPTAVLTPNLETPLFAPLEPNELAMLESAEPAVRRSNLVTWDESLLLTSDEPLEVGLPTAPERPLEVAAMAPQTVEAKPEAQAAAMPGRAAGQAREPVTKTRVTGRTSETPPFERRTSYSSRTQSVAPRSYRDVRERDSKPQSRRQPLGLWLAGIALLAGSAVFLVPNLAQRLQQAMTPRAAAVATPPAVSVTPSKPSPTPTPRAVQPLQKPKPVVVPRLASNPAPKQAATVKPVAKPAPAPQPSPQPVATAQPAPSATAPSKPTSAPVVPAKVVAPAPVQARPAPSARVATKPRVAPTAPKASAASPRTGAAALPPVTRPEGTTTRVTQKPSPKPSTASTAKPAVAKPSATKPAAKKPAPAPPKPVASIEYQEQQATQLLPGGLTRAEYGRQFLNRKQFEVWQAQGAVLNFQTWDEIPFETQVLPSADFKAAVLVSLQPPGEPNP